MKLSVNEKNKKVCELETALLYKWFWVLNLPSPSKCLLFPDNRERERGRAGRGVGEPLAYFPNSGCFIETFYQQFEIAP